MNQPEWIILPFLRKEPVASNTYSFYFNRKGTHFTFFPGQYIRVTFPLTTGKHKISHFFTIASSPLEKDYIRITTKMSNSDFKNKLAKLYENELVEMFGPLGGFYLHDDEKFHHVFLAGGIGITPFYSMIMYALQKKLQLNITLIASFISSDEIIFYNELMSVAKANHNIRVVYTITRSTDTEIIWRGETGRISENILKKYISDIANARYYIVGSPEMIEDTEEVLQLLNVKDGNIKIEQFTGY